MGVDLSQLEAPEVIQNATYEEVFAAMLTDLQGKDATLELSESDPVYKVLEVAAYREYLMRKEFNDRAQGLMLAYAKDADLDHIGITYYRTKRLIIDAGDPTAVPPVDPIYESDEAYLARCLIAEDAFSTAGPETAYRYFALSADALVKDVSVVSPTFERVILTQAQIDALPARAIVYIPIDDAGLADPTPASVVVTTLSHIGDGTPEQALLDAVDIALADDVRPITDEVIVQAPTIINYTINASLILYADANISYTRQLAEDALIAYVERCHELGHSLTVVGVTAAMKIEGVHDVILNDTGNGTDMVANIDVTKREAAYCTGLTVSVGGTV